MKHGCWLAVAFLLSPAVQPQQIEKTHPAGTVREALLSRPAGAAREAAATARDFATFRDPAWSVLTMAQIGAASADAVTSLNNLRRCSNCLETGPSSFFVGRRPDAHKYILSGTVEIAAEAVAAHYFRNHSLSRKWYWRALWTLPQSFSLYEHAHAAQHNAALLSGCFPSGPDCH